MANKKLPREELVISPKHPEWLDTFVAESHFDNDLYRIILFFVIFSPCPKYCTQGRTLQFYNWKDKPWSTNKYLKDKLDDGVFSNKKKYFQCASQIPKLVEAVRKADLGDEFYLYRETERVAFTSTENSEYMSLFHHIRCALARGRIAMFEEQGTENIIFVMENGIDCGTDFQVKARMVLRKSTLLKWIAIITKGPQEPEKTYYKEVYAALLNNKKLRIKDLMSMFEESEYAINKAISFLKRWNIISYQNHGKNSWLEVNVSNANLCFEKLDS